MVMELHCFIVPREKVRGAVSVSYLFSCLCCSDLTIGVTTAEMSGSQWSWLAMWLSNRVGSLVLMKL
jgi:hypothetical protein